MRIGILIVPLLALSAGAAPAFQAPSPAPASPNAAARPRPDRFGQISEIKGDVFTLTGRRGTVTVTIPSSATVEGREGAAASREDLKVGTRIGVYGEAKADGSLTATRVVLMPAGMGRNRGVGGVGGVGGPVAPVTVPKITVPALNGPVYPQITVDTTGAPDLAGFANRSKAICEAFYPRIAAYLKSDGFTPPRSFKIIFREMDGVAYTAGDEINCSAAYFRTHLDDYGAVVHEMTHVIQHYQGDNPGWLVEAVDDYVRFYRYEPSTEIPHANPDRVSDKPEAYRVGAQFLDWTQAKYDKDLVPKLNKAMREGTYSDDLFKTYTGHTLDALWTEWKTSLRPAATVAAATK